MESFIKKQLDKQIKENYFDNDSSFELSKLLDNKIEKFVVKANSQLIKEDRDYIPRFSLKDLKVFQDCPVNEPIPYNEKIIIKAIQYGMILLVKYKGEHDKTSEGNTRVIYPLVYGKSSKGNLLLRGFHLQGYSVSQGTETKKIWRMFRTDRIKSITFLGSFYRLPPVGYKALDKGMRGGIIAYANFSTIRANQQSLLKLGAIQNKDDISLSNKGTQFTVVVAKPTDTILDITKPFENKIIDNITNLDLEKITFLKSVSGNKYVAMLGAIGTPGNIVKILSDDKNIKKTIGTFRVMDSIGGNVLKRIKQVKGVTEYELYRFTRKIDNQIAKPTFQ